jgi:ribosomal protein S12 methylthiotransferase accessory factor
MSEPNRYELREGVASLVNALSQAQRYEFGISRVGDVTGLDTIGLPVYIAVRTLSQTVSISAGKGLTPQASRAAAIVEAIELELAENPKGQFRVARAIELPEEERLAPQDCNPSRASIVNDLTPLAWEEATNIQNGETKLIPSDKVWMRNRIENQPLSYFQASSNGLAGGGTLEDAILSGLYEIIERDAWTISHYMSDSLGLLPNRTPLIGLPKALEAIVRKIEAANLKLYLFDLTTDYKVPVFNATLLDLNGNCVGLFAGFGAHLNAEVAAIRAVTEAAQSRCCYIAGARDDLFRRQFLLMKRVDQEKLDTMYAELPAASALSEYRSVEFPDVKTELRYLLKLIRSCGVSEVYVRPIGSVLSDQLHVVRVFSPQCEPVHLDSWTPGQRCLYYAARKLAELAHQSAPPPTPTPPVEEGEEWKL